MSMLIPAYRPASSLGFVSGLNLCALLGHRLDAVRQVNRILLQDIASTIPEGAPEHVLRAIRELRASQYAYLFSGILDWQKRLNRARVLGGGLGSLFMLSSLVITLNMAMSSHIALALTALPISMASFACILISNQPSMILQKRLGPVMDLLRAYNEDGQDYWPARMQAAIRHVTESTSGDIPPVLHALYHTMISHTSKFSAAVTAYPHLSITDHVALDALATSMLAAERDELVGGMSLSGESQELMHRALSALGTDGMEACAHIQQSAPKVF